MTRTISKPHHLESPPSAHQSSRGASKCRILGHIYSFRPAPTEISLDKLSVHTHQFLFVQHLGDSPPITVHNDVFFQQRSLDWVFGPENLTQLFESATSRLDEEEIDDDELECVPEDEKEVVLNMWVSAGGD